MVNMRADSPGSAGAAAMSPAEEDYDNFVQLTNVRKSSGEEDEDYQNFVDDSSGDLQQMGDGRCNTSDNAGGTGRVRVEQEKRMRREIANCNERRRMQSINAGFLSLRALLPRRDGEKMSKASILQQTADMIQSLQAEKMQLIHEKMQMKRSLEQQCGGAEHSPMSSMNNCDDARVPSTKPHIMAPPKKRRRFVDDVAIAAAAAESSDEGVGMMSDDTDVLKAPSSPPKPDAAARDSVCSDKSWELEVIQRQLIELRLAFDRERRLRLLYEEELRKRDINNLRGSMGHIRVSSLLDTAASSSALGTTTQLVNVAPALKHTVESLVSLHGCALSPPPSSADSPALVPNNPYYAAPTVVSAAPVANAMATSLGQSSSSKQSLEAIVEAIRHLEGDQLFVDTEQHMKTDISRLDLSNNVLTSSSY